MGRNVGQGRDQEVVAMAPDGERRARVTLSFLAKPGGPVLGKALRSRTAAELLALVTGADADGEALLAAGHRMPSWPALCRGGGSGSARSRAPAGWQPGRTGGTG
ncbi:MAG TPA: hypothetical protein VMA72_10210 [Streptosporangiaceae bacterium]|nr:hypothetical protein [Streptosporangiaceae bacterium]